MRAVIGSVAVHVVLAWLAFHGDREGTPRATAKVPVAITMTEAVEVDLLPSTEGGVLAEDGSTGGMESGARAAGAPPTASMSHARVTPTRSPALDTDPRGAITIDRIDPHGDVHVDDGNLSGAPRSGTLDARGDRARDTGAGGSGAGGRGIGRGGTGTGIGFGDGGSIPRSELLAPPPAPPGDPPSKARPARLIYPTRQRDVEDAELFVARVIIDDEGFVGGARLVRGFGGRRDEVAAQMIWKFRYAPALDDGGRPIRSTLDQRFLVGP